MNNKGDVFVKLENLEVKSLYNSYDYSVKFNSDVTIIYGSNGCGKTTILNMIANIITGNIYELFDYQFKSIELTYFESRNYDKKHKIIIRSSSDRYELKVRFNNKEYSIDRANEIFDADYRYELHRRYFDKYPFLDKIKRTFNYVYLPLNRNISINYEQEKFMYRHSRPRLYRDNELVNVNNYNSDMSMIYVEDLIRDYCMKMNSYITRINDDFRNQLLKSLLNINKNYNLNILNDEIKENLPSKNEILKIQKAYMRILNDINLINEEEEKQYNKFFDDFIEELNKNSYKQDNDILITLLFKFNEILKIREIVNLAETMEAKKASHKKPVETFLQTITEFISSDENEKKEIRIDLNGEIFFTTVESQERINIQHLSSGEKQLITFFSNLIFGVNNNKSGIFVVDEPELSLHLAWQKIFIKKTLEINKNIQLIFATHSPEIVANYTDRMFRLVKHSTKELKGQD